jgi:mono/diheme cytochrome c family protein
MMCLKNCVAAMTLVIAPAVSFAWPWNNDMANQISVKPQKGAEAVRQYPQRSVPAAGTRTVRVSDMDAANKMVNPNQSTPASIANGKRMYQIYCETCHGASGQGDGPVGAKLVLKPYDLTTDKVQKELPEGYIFGYMTLGGAIMPSYANDLYPSERWDLINYIRHALKGEKPVAVGVK